MPALRIINRSPVAIASGKRFRIVLPGYRAPGGDGDFALEEKRAEDEFARIKRFDISVPIETPDAKRFETVKNGETIVDYRNVRIKGYLSTFGSPLEVDRQGEYVEKGAFTETLAKFRENPVMLIDHRNICANLAGRFVEIVEDGKGLRFEALLSDRPGNIDIRFLVVEGNLKTTSIGGFWHYKEDGRGIFKVDLFEGSLTPVPANPKCAFQVRALNEQEKRFMKSGFTNYYDFLQAESVKTMRE